MTARFTAATFAGSPKYGWTNTDNPLEGQMVQVGTRPCQNAYPVYDSAKAQVDSDGVVIPHVVAVVKTSYSRNCRCWFARIIDRATNLEYRSTDVTLVRIPLTGPVYGGWAARQDAIDAAVAHYNTVKAGQS